jgi:hypothetical protein
VPDADAFAHDVDDGDGLRSGHVAYDSGWDWSSDSAGPQGNQQVEQRATL